MGSTGPVGVIYGDASASEYHFATRDGRVKRLDYVAAGHPSGPTLGQVVRVQRRDKLSFDQAVSMESDVAEGVGDGVACHVKVIGYRDDRGLLQVPRTPFRPGTEVHAAPADLIQAILGLTMDRREGAYLGHLRTTHIPVALGVEHLVQKHASVLAKTGAGKSYTVGVLMEELLLRRVPLVVVDPHGEYPSLANPNIEDAEIDAMARFGIKPKGFHQMITEYTLEERTEGRQRLALEGCGVDAREIVDLLPTKLSGSQVGLLYQAVNEVRQRNAQYTFVDIVEELTKSPSNAKWNVISALETLDATNLFVADGTPVSDLVRPGHATILNLKGTAPDIQEIAVARLSRILFNARKRNQVPPFMLVVEEAHNFCPERGLDRALSGPELRTIASEGRKFGMGLLIVSQRPAKIDKNVLSQCNTQIIMKLTNPNDLKAVAQSVEGITSETADEIQRLGTGVAIVAGGNLVHPVLVEVRTRMSRHGGASVSVLAPPEEGQDDDDDGLLEPVDLEAEPARSLGAQWSPGEAEDAAPDRPVRFPAPRGEEAEPDHHGIDPGAMEAGTADAQGLAVPPDAAPDPGPAPAPEPDPDPPAPAEDEEVEIFEPMGLDFPVEAPETQPSSPGAEEEAEPRIVDGTPVEPPPLVEPEVQTGTPPPVELEQEVAAVPEDAPDELPEVRPSDEVREEVLHRILGRLGHERAGSPSAAVAEVTQMAYQIANLPPQDYLDRFEKVGANYCYPSMPECGPCPLLDACRLGLERLARGEVRRGRWGSVRR